MEVKDMEDEDWKKEYEEKAEEGRRFVFAEHAINSVEDIVLFEQKYTELADEIELPWMLEESYDFKECNLSFLCKRPFRRVSKQVDPENPIMQRFLKYGLSDIEISVMWTYLGEASGLYRLDEYYYGIPPVVNHLVQILQSALDKLPHHGDLVVVRQLKDHDKVDFKEEDVFEPCYSLTTSSNPAWNDGSWEQYIIKTLPVSQTKARSIAFASNYEMQITFLIGARFEVTNVETNESGKRRIYMNEIE